MTKPTLWGLLGEWVSVNHPEKKASWNGKLVGLDANAPLMYLRTAPGQTIALPQDYTVDHIDLPRAEETDGDHGKPLHCRLCADAYLDGAVSPTPPLALDIRLTAPVTKDQAQHLRNVIRAALDAQGNRATEAEVALARFHEGEEPVTDPAVEPTPGQWIWQWNRATPAERLEAAGRAIDHAVRSSVCFEMAHEWRLAEEKKAWVALARVQDVIADMEGITGARHWARILRTAINREQPSGPAATQATKAARVVDTAQPAACDAYQPPVSPADSGLCARCGMSDYKHHTAPDPAEPRPPAEAGRGQV
ncbi:MULTISPECIES: hypothetical protein [Streptomyces]|uniref:hypothetical protein n=1 Tax=Streptomyces TaxID=1883 RepID=UPI0029A03A5E|nr:hypothetical protein [Streptomyces stelliscabiei]MDX2520562.1 hypothetical protein [Streptomyces stelliscabiei]MDX2552659.1 hypothetical protein [Streptomyces stelliscabiei]MDX2661343.1 hypothetical protein [Streptomyces stelliscabiei]MDX2788824.1 hypothetical protein [Streptomyces stelliscabiei]